MENRRIILTTLEYPPFRGGAGIYCEELAYSAAAKQNLEMEVWCPKGSKGSKEVKLNTLPFPGSQSLFCSLKTMLEIKKRFREQNNQRILLHIAEPACLRAFIRFGGLIKEMPPYYVTIHGSELIRFRRNFFERNRLEKILYGAEKIHVLSHYNRKAILNIFPSLEKKVFQIPGAPARRILPKSSFTANNNKEDEKLRILSVGRIHPRKGQNILLQVMRELPKEILTKVELNIVGPIVDSSFHKRLLGICEMIDAQIHFLGDLQDQELRSIFESSDIFVLTPLQLEKSVEGFGFSFLEASSHGLPILASRSGGIEDSVKDGQTGILIDPTNTKEFAKSLERLIRNQNLRKELGQNGKKWASLHSWERVVRELYLDD